MEGKKNIYDKFDKTSQQIVVRASAASVDAEIDTIYPEAFMIGILLCGSNCVTNTFLDMDMDLNKCLKNFKKKLLSRRSLDSNPMQKAIHYNELKISKEILNVVETADKYSVEEECNNITIEHIFCALLKVSPYIAIVLEQEGFTMDRFMERLDGPDSDKELAGVGLKPLNKSRKTNALKAFCTDLTEEASNNKFDPIIARETEIELAITILCRRGKNNPIFLGNPGVGKTAIVEGIAQRIVSGTVPKQLLGTKLYSLNLSSIVAGTKYRGEFEERLQALVKEIQNDPKCMLFIDEIHTLIGAGSASGALDASNILKPFLARSDLRCIGATTLEDYKKYFQKDGALVRRFQQIMVEEPDHDQMRKILVGIRSRYERYHDCIITDDALDAVINLSARYLSDKRFPDKAIDCMDTACAKFAWHNRETAGKPTVTATDIARVVGEICQIPVEVILWDDNERIKKIEQTLLSRVIGQDAAINTVCKILKNAYSGIRDPHRPIGSFVFGGQTGTGKTYMAKELAQAVFGKEDSLIRVDMTEFTEPHSVSKLIGSPPGYVGFREIDIFVDKIRRKPYCIVLLDEIEKAHKDVMRLFMQVLSDGQMTDAVGEKVDFKNVVIIMTGNFGLNTPPQASLGFNSKEVKQVADEEQKRLVSYCQNKYGSEFINRIDEFIPFMPLSDESLRKITGLMLNEIVGRVVNRNCGIVFSDKVFDLLVEKSKKEYGKNANIFKRLISREIEPCVSDILMDAGNAAYAISIDVEDGAFVGHKSGKIENQKSGKRNAASQKATTVKNLDKKHDNKTQSA
jgi:ATP-dependent Clp protease ATP-binding subunit ClpC